MSKLDKSIRYMNNTVLITVFHKTGMVTRTLTNTGEMQYFLDMFNDTPSNMIDIDMIPISTNKQLRVTFGYSNDYLKHLKMLDKTSKGDIE